MIAGFLLAVSLKPFQLSSSVGIHELLELPRRTYIAKALLKLATSAQTGAGLSPGQRHWEHKTFLCCERTKSVKVL